MKKNDQASGKVRWFGALRVKEIVQVTHNVKTFRLVNPKGGEIPFQHVAGQYLTLDIAPHGIATRRSYTIASPPNWRDRIEITVKREDHGHVSRWLHDDVQVGELVNVEAPNGIFVFSGQERPSIVLIGGGVGITPMMSIARYLTDTQWPGTIYLVTSFQTPQDIIFGAEIEQMRTRNPHLHVATTVTQTEGTEWSGSNGRISSRFLQTHVPDIALHSALICGPTPMMDAVRAMLLELGMPASQIKTEAFGTDKRDHECLPPLNPCSRLVHHVLPLSWEIAKNRDFLGRKQDLALIVPERAGAKKYCRVALSSLAPLNRNPYLTEDG